MKPANVNATSVANACRWYLARPNQLKTKTTRKASSGCEMWYGDQLSHCTAKLERSSVLWVFLRPAMFVMASGVGILGTPSPVSRSSGKAFG